MRKILQNKKLLAFLTLIALFIIVAYLSFPFLTAFFGGLIMFVLFLPIKRRLNKKYSNHTSTWITVFISVIAITLFFTIFLMAVARGIMILSDDLISLNIFGRELKGLIPGIESDITWGELITRFAPDILGPIDSIISNVFHLFSVLFILHALLYYLLLDEQKFFKNLRKVLPFNEKNTEIIIKRFYDVTYSAILGDIIIAFVQGGLMSLAFVVTGLPAALFWGLITALLALIPFLGSPFVSVPAAIYLLYTDQIPQAIIMIVFGIVITLVDNFLRPIINKKFGEIHPLITIIGVFIGIYEFGFIGIFIGPLLVAYFILVWKMYNKEYM